MVQRRWSGQMGPGACMEGAVRPSLMEIARGVSLQESRYPCPVRLTGRANRKCGHSLGIKIDARSLTMRDRTPKSSWMAIPIGFEPTTYSSANCRSIQLSYGIMDDYTSLYAVDYSTRQSIVNSFAWYRTMTFPRVSRTNATLAVAFLQLAR